MTVKEPISVAEIYHTFMAHIEKDEIQIQNAKLKLRLAEVINDNRDVTLEIFTIRETNNMLTEQNQILSDNVNLWKEKANNYYNLYLALDVKRNDIG